MKYLLILLVSFLSTLHSTAQSIKISEIVQSDIQFMREEEKLARDVYDSLYLKWDLIPFEHIRTSEQNHMDQMKSLLNKFNLSDPVQITKDKKGLFQNALLSQYYNDLIAQGSNSVIDALKVGAKIEEIDIKDLIDRAKNTKDKSILAVYENLRLASERHLNAFTRNLHMRGIEYQPTILSTTLYNEIIKD